MNWHVLICFFSFLKAFKILGILVNLYYPLNACRYPAVCTCNLAWQLHVSNDRSHCVLSTGCQHLA